jgi:hypothetical protein
LHWLEWRCGQAAIEIIFMTQDTETGIWIGVASFLLLTAVATLTSLSPIAFWLLN